MNEKTTIRFVLTGVKYSQSDLGKHYKTFCGLYKAKVTDKGEMKEVPGSDGEYHYWESDEWYYIDKNGQKSEEN